ncbi:MAG TPA: alpha/beta hydrolase [Planctomycetaceae bacterium]|nr:alpha/beta hydrolase [Planctomycetaceae bacterium]
MNRLIATCLAFSTCCGVLLAQEKSTAPSEGTPSEQALRKLLGEGTPKPVPLWPGKPPQFLENAPPEVVDERASIHMVSVPTISPYLPPAGKGTGMAIIVCPGGGYGALGWKTGVVYAADYFVPKGVAVIGLKYRLRPPHRVDNAGIQALALLDAKRAVRLVRDHAQEWHLDPHKIGIAGYSAGANLAINLAANFDAGDKQSTDRVERQSSRPDFAVGLSTWHWRRKNRHLSSTRTLLPCFSSTRRTTASKEARPSRCPKRSKPIWKNSACPFTWQSSTKALTASAT